MRCGMSPATCHRRLRRLEREGVIERRVAILSADRIGAGLTGIVEVTLDRQGAEHQAHFERRVLDEPAVQQCFRVSAGPDFVLVAVARDMDAWGAFVERLFTQDGNVRNVKTFFSVRRVKVALAVPLPPATRRRLRT